MVKLTKKKSFQRLCDIFEKIIVSRYERHPVMREAFRSKDTVKIKRPKEYIDARG